uniref:uncharacterized protein LOC122608227 n=1 Tax=Erigeron canadensis TaxID=72917 RepID=UPI001CB9605E|nr:uncharacterized protein LOC122608227 [Erigeron canadensis]
MGGCFLGCFGPSKKDRKQRIKQQSYKVISRDHQVPKIQNLVQADVSLVQRITDKPSISLPDSSEKKEELLSVSTRKKVTFDTNVTTYEHIQVFDSTESLLEKNEKGETFPKSVPAHTDSGSQDDSDVVSVGSYPPNYRYGNCVESDDELEDFECEDEIEEGLDDEEEEDYYDEDRIICQEVWCESIPVLSEESRKESNSVVKNVSNGNARDRSVYVDPVLNPVENLSQWKALKSKGIVTPVPKPLNSNLQKENSFLNSAWIPPKNNNQEIAVDASLSNWLGSNSIPNNKRVDSISSGKSLSQESTTTSVMSNEERPILGALTLDELNQFSGSASTPRKSPGRSPDDMAIIGSVGSYWSHTGSANSLSSTSSYKGIPNTTSKYREDKRVNWHNTPFETRLERALNRDTAEA